MTMNIRMISELQRSKVITSKPFDHMKYKTQVCFPSGTHAVVVRDRQSHSHEVANSAGIMAAFIADQKGWQYTDIDYQGSLEATCLAHDVGHSALGHDGADLISQYFQERGVEEGFSDNNNNLVVLEKNDVLLSDYTLSSVIKYPTKLYPYQKDKYLPILEAAIEQDKEHFAQLGLPLSRQTLTVACQIMDEADRNTYVCSDLADFICLGNTLPRDEIVILAKKAKLTYLYTELVTLFSIVESGKKNAIKAYFNSLKNRFNMNFKLTEKGIKVIDRDLQAYREFLFNVEKRYFIQPLRQETFHHENMRKLKTYLDSVVIQGFTPSRTYGKIIAAADTKIAKLRAQRDMVAEATDWYVTGMQQNHDQRNGPYDTPD
jgi:dGTP triphosphohydrolase